jgi:hypothetical protein
MQPRLFLSFLSFALLPDKKRVPKQLGLFDGVEGIIILSETVSPQKYNPPSSFHLP